MGLQSDECGRAIVAADLWQAVVRDEKSEIDL